MHVKKTTSERIAQNIIMTYGEEKFLYLLNQLAQGVPGTEIMLAFGVTRQRINQWKRKLGVEHVTYVLTPEVDLLLGRLHMTTLARSPE